MIWHNVTEALRQPVMVLAAIGTTHAAYGCFVSVVPCYGYVLNGTVSIYDFVHV